MPGVGTISTVNTAAAALDSASGLPPAAPVREAAATPAALLAAIRAPVTADLAAVDTTIRRELSSDVVLINSIGEYIVGSGGKRLRPLLVLLSARAAGYRGEEHYVAAALVEFIHTATLLHDDVVDESHQRRGRDTANEVFGSTASVLVGDFLYSRAFQMMVRLNRMPIMDILADATNTIAAGEVLQLMNQGDPDTTEERYLEVIYRKTARLFEAGAEVGAVLAQATPEQRRALGAYGRHLGNAFQLVDDALDYRSDAAERGKNLGDDLAEGKPTMPLLHALKHGTPAQQALIRQAIAEGGLEHLAEITAAIESTGGLDYTAKLAQDEARRASAALEGLPGSPYVEALAGLARFAVTRTT
jgi:octaprenyl-diphosphate synthase